MSEDAGDGRMLLRDPEVFPDDAALRDAMGKKLHAVFEALSRAVVDVLPYAMEWRYYRDGKAWLCKVTHGKKTIAWVSVWAGHLRTSFYFTEKTRAGVLELQIDPQAKVAFSEVKPIGRLFPLVLDIRSQRAVEDFVRICRYKQAA